ncbi:hypothetical protein Btru_054899 [Bulinus truncatus]|nr:hypothetical protein Btru_054899 [Bulinus truncatus]
MKQSYIAVLVASIADGAFSSGAIGRRVVDIDISMVVDGGREYIEGSGWETARGRSDMLKHGESLASHGKVRILNHETEINEINTRRQSVTK